MPYLKIQTNLAPDSGVQAELMSFLSKTVAEQLGKPEHYVMVAIETGIPMMFAADDGPLAYMELKSIGLPESRTSTLAESLCAAVEKGLGIPGDRIYIEFANAKSHMWGWNKDTF